MRTFALALVLLMPVVVGAGELSIQIYGNGSIAECDINFNNCKVTDVKSFPCYAKMQEALRSAYGHIEYRDRKIGFVSPGVVMSPEAKDEFDKTMRECVEGK